MQTVNEVARDLIVAKLDEANASRKSSIQRTAELLSRRNPEVQKAIASIMKQQILDAVECPEKTSDQPFIDIFSSMRAMILLASLAKKVEEAVEKTSTSLDSEEVEKLQHLQTQRDELIATLERWNSLNKKREGNPSGFTAEHQKQIARVEESMCKLILQIQGVSKKKRKERLKREVFSAETAQRVIDETISRIETEQSRLHCNHARNVVRTEIAAALPTCMHATAEEMMRAYTIRSIVGVSEQLLDTTILDFEKNASGARANTIFNMQQNPRNQRQTALVIENGRFIQQVSPSNPTERNYPEIFFGIKLPAKKQIRALLHLEVIDRFQATGICTSKYDKYERRLILNDYIQRAAEYEKDRREEGNTIERSRRSTHRAVISIHAMLNECLASFLINFLEGDIPEGQLRLWIMKQLNIEGEIEDEELFVMMHEAVIRVTKSAKLLK